MAASRAHILLALENVCRREMQSQYHPLNRCANDAQAVNWGPHTPEIAREVAKISGAPNTYQKTRRALQALVADGLALRASPHSRVVRYWPVGLWGKQQAEKAAAEQAALYYKHDNSFAGAA